MKHVVITGATSGIGEQLARDYARQGWQVTACGRNQDKLAAMAKDHASLTPWRLTRPTVNKHIKHWVASVWCQI